MPEGGRHFVDQVRVFVKAGDGGHGCISFQRQRGQPFGGPDGGDGGRGGSVILEADPQMATLVDIKLRPHLVAKRGDNGGTNRCSGRGAEDIIVKVPLGCVAVDFDTGEELGDLTEAGQRLVVARGGDGGRGNQHFATATNKAPRRAEDGWPGEQRTLLLELKIIADVGFVGLPNAGKSTLLAALTNANPEIAPYPFTTLSPNLGVFVASDMQRRITLADIPGLIEGAHEGLGLGHRFLRHVERTRVLVHLVAPEAGVDESGAMVLADASPETMLYSFNLVREELRAYSPLLLEKPTIVCINKADLMDDEQAAAVVEAFVREHNVRPHVISAATGIGIEELRLRLEQVVLEAQDDPELPRP